MNRIVAMIMLVIMAITGGGSTIAIAIGMPAKIIWKIHRKIRYGYKLTD